MIIHYNIIYQYADRKLCHYNIEKYQLTYLVSPALLRPPPALRPFLGIFLLPLLSPSEKLLGTFYEPHLQKYQTVILF